MRGMKKYTNIPFKERKHNADRCYRHEVRLEEIIQKQEMKAKEQHYEKGCKTDKETQEDEAFARLLKIIEESEETE